MGTLNETMTPASQMNMDQAFDVFDASYKKSTGKSWDKQKFISRAYNWVFFGNDKGYDQVLWTDAFEHKIGQEIGTMNVFFVVGEKIWTPALVSETILAGITRDTAITLFRETGYEVEERQINIEELIEAYKAGQLKEAFGAGTAATISMIKELTYKDFIMKFDTDSWKVCTAMKALGVS